MTPVEHFGATICLLLILGAYAGLITVIISARQVRNCWFILGFVLMITAVLPLLGMILYTRFFLQ